MAFPIQAILCAVDFSPFCSLVLDYGVILARRAGVRLYLLHAIHHPQDRIHPTLVFERGGYLTHFMEDAKQRMHGLMENAAVDWEAVVRIGDPVEQIMTVVDALPPCLVISASHGVSGFRRFFIGTVVERLSRTLDRPMLVVKPAGNNGGDRESGFRSVVISCDIHGHWRSLTSLLNLLQPDPTLPIHLVHAMEGPVDTVRDEPAASYGEVQQALRERLINQYRQHAERLFPLAGQVSTVVAPGEPEDMVLQVAREQGADLIVVGVRPSGRMGRLISGSTTEALLRHGPCCVLTVPEPRDPVAPVGDLR